MRLAGIRSLLALGLSLLAIRPASAHFYPDPGGHAWQLLGQETFTYFVPDDAVVTDTQRAVVASVTLAKTTERQGEASQTVREDGAAVVERREAEEPGPKAVMNRIEGRFRNTYEHQRLDRVEHVKTIIPFEMVAITTYQTRIRTLARNTYQDVQTVTWVDPTTGEALSGKVVRTEDPVEETSFTAWVDHTDRRVLSSGRDATEVANILSSRVVIRKTGSAPALATGTGVNGTKGSGSSQVAFSDGSQRGGRSDQNATAAASRRLTAATQAKSTGGAASQAIASAVSLIGARGVDLVNEAGTPVFRMLSRGKGLVFLPYDQQGKLVENAEKARSTATVGNFEFKDGKLVAVSGSFSNPVLGPAGAAQRLMVR